MKPDLYVWKARRCPVLLAVLPPALAVLAMFPDAKWKLMLPLCTFCGLLMLIGQWAVIGAMSTKTACTLLGAASRLR